MKTNMIATLMVAMVITGLLSVVAGDAQGEEYDIGDEVGITKADNGVLGAGFYTNDVWVFTKADAVKPVSALFDGNRSTNMDKRFDVGYGYLDVELIFMDALYIHNITVFPFGAGYSEIQTMVVFPGGASMTLGSYTDMTELYYVNGTVASLWFFITPQSNPPDNREYYFDEVVINYTPRDAAAMGYDKRLDELEKQVANLTDDMGELETDVTVLNVTVTVMGDNITALEVTQAVMVAELGLLWDAIADINATLADLQAQIDELAGMPGPDTAWVVENITRIDRDVRGLWTAVGALENATIEIPPPDNTEVVLLQERVNRTVLDITELEELVGELLGIDYGNGTTIIRGGYNDTALLERIIALEAENSRLAALLDESAPEPPETPDEAAGESSLSIWDLAGAVFVVALVLLILVVYPVASSGRAWKRQVAARERLEAARAEPVAPPVLSPAVGYSDVPRPTDDLVLRKPAVVKKPDVPMLESGDAKETGTVIVFDPPESMRKKIHDD